MAFAIGHGSVLSAFTATTTGTATEIGQIKSIDGPSGSGTDVDTTTLDTAGNFRTFARGPTDPGELSITVAYDPTVASHQELGTLYASGAEKAWLVYHGSTSGTAQEFKGYVSSLGRAIPLDDLITVDVTIKVSGDPAYTTT